MAKLLSLEEMAKSVAEKALDEYLYQEKSLREWIKIIREQEHCEDCISRQAVISTIYNSKSHFKNDFAQGFFADKIMDLPPVIPQPKIGKWIDDKCSICGKGIEDLLDSPEWYENEEPNFCPFCGTKMETDKEAENEQHTD